VTAGIVLNLIFSISCNDSKSYEELKEEERVIIKRIIAEKGIEVLSEYPVDGVFGEKQFVELDNGIYLNVVDSGNGNRAVVNSTTILIRTSGYIYDTTDTPYYFNTFANTAYPFEFKYGLAYNVVSEHASYSDSYALLFGQSLEHALAYVGDSAIVQMIVPGYSEINELPAGSTYQSSNRNQYYPIFYNKIRYIFY
jgi:hypothetical protein